jgi:predicted nuclease of predicted toxin-antitoxin system
VKFLVDNQLPEALARFLTSQGVECRHVLELNLAAASDAEIWTYASEHDSVVISKDVDFLYFASASPGSARFVWVRLGNCRTKALLSAIEQLWPKVEAALAAGDRIVEIR